MSGAACAKVILCGGQLAGRLRAAADRLGFVAYAIEEHKDDPTYMPQTDASLAAIVDALEDGETAIKRIEKAVAGAEAALGSGIGYTG